MDKKAKIKLDNFFSKYKFQQYKKGAVIISANCPPAGIFYLTKGIIRRYSISKKGMETTLNIFKPFSFFPLSWAFNDELDNHCYEALTEVGVWSAPKATMVQLIKKDPEILFDLLQRIYRGMEGYTKRMEYLLSGDAPSRLIVEFLIYAKRFGRMTRRGIVIDLKLTQKDIASQVGMARETVVRQMQLFKKMGLIDFKKNILVIKNIQRLEGELS